MCSADFLRTMFNKYVQKLLKEQQVALIKEGHSAEDAEDIHLTEIPSYTLRYTHATVLLNNNENIRVISERLGHKSIEITHDTYVTAMPKRRSKTADLLD